VEQASGIVSRHDAGTGLSINRISFKKERAPFFIERLEHTQIQNGGIRLDLTEIGIQRPIERYTRCQSKPNIHTSRPEEVASGRMCISLWHKWSSADGKRQNLQRSTGMDILNSVKVTEARVKAVKVIRPIRPSNLLILPVNVSGNLNALDVFRAWTEPEDVIRNLELAAPSSIVNLSFPDPHTIPGTVGSAVLMRHCVPLPSGRAHPEHKPCLVVVSCVDVDDDAVPINPEIPSFQGSPDFVRLAVQTVNRKVDRVVIVDHPDLCALRRWIAIDRIPLTEVRRHRGWCPGRIVQLAIYYDPGVTKPDSRNATLLPALFNLSFEPIRFVS
jgi:hypothetical protein